MATRSTVVAKTEAASITAVAKGNVSEMVQAARSGIRMAEADKEVDLVVKAV